MSDTPDTPLPEPAYSITFTKRDADLLASICDVCVKATGIASVDAVQIWLGKVRDAMKVG